MILFDNNNQNTKSVLRTELMKSSTQTSYKISNSIGQGIGQSNKVASISHFRPIRILPCFHWSTSEVLFPGFVTVTAYILVAKVVEGRVVEREQETGNCKRLTPSCTGLCLWQQQLLLSQSKKQIKYL